MTLLPRPLRSGIGVLAVCAVSGLFSAPAAYAAPTAEPSADAAQTVTGSTLEWGVRESFRSYIEGPIARGQWSTIGEVADDAAGVLTWTGSAGEVDAEAEQGTLSFSGGVHYTGHEGHFEEGEPALSVEIENPTLSIDDGGGVLYADVESVNLDQEIVGGEQIAFAELSLDEVTFGEDRLAGVAQATLTEAGAEAFAGFYEPGEPLDPISFSADLEPAPEQDDETEEPTPEPTEEPSSEPPQEPEETPSPSPSESPSPSPSTSPTSGGSNSPSPGSGGSGNSGNSDSGGSSSGGGSSNSGPGNPGSGNSGGSGSEAGTGSPNPQGSAGQGGAAPSAEQTEDEPATTTETICEANGVSGATLSWGLRESFRSYIQGGIAQGDWTLNGTSYSSGAFQWSDGSGSFDSSAVTGSVGYSGGVHFTGHDGVLDLQIDNPTIRVTGANSAVLTADVLSTTMDGDRIDLTGVTFAEISGDISVSGDTVSASGASVTLTSDGADAFAGFYEPGEPLDPISFSFPLGAETDCVEVEVDADGNIVGGGPGGGLAQTGATGGGVVLGSAALLAVGLILLALRHRRRHEEITVSAS